MSDIVERLRRAERWADIVGYEGKYQVSDLGNVRRLRYVNGHSDRALETPASVPAHLCSGYSRVPLWKSNKQSHALVHRLVLEAFVGPCPEGHNCSHKDGSRTNNSIENLEWATISENCLAKREHGTMQRGEDCYNSVLTEGKVKFIRSAKGMIKQIDLAQMFGVTRSTIQRVQAGTSWSHI